MTIEVTPERLIEVENLIHLWLDKKEASLREIQSHIGKLNFVASCVRSSRIFVSRQINWLKELYNYQPHVYVTIPPEGKINILWWNKFLQEYNGVSIMLYEEWSNPDDIFLTDSCLVGFGGFFKGKYFHYVFPENILNRNLSISVLELFCIIIALKLWLSEFKGKR
jgi:hypothetical protein